MPTILYGNMKGGVGKTTNSVMTAYQLARKGYKTLVCDLDPQANATQLLRRTYALQHNNDLKIEKTMMVALTEEISNLPLLTLWIIFIFYLHQRISKTILIFLKCDLCPTKKKLL